LWKKNSTAQAFTNNRKKIDLAMHSLGFYRDENDELSVQGIKVSDLAKKYGDYEEFKKSFKHEDSSEKHVLNVQETEDKVTVEFAKEHDESMPKGLDETLAQEKTMSDIDIDAIVASAVEKTAAAMAMKEAERKAEEQKQLEAEQKAAEEAAAQKTAEEARISTAVQSGTEKLMADLEEKLNAKDADYNRIIGELKEELTQKSEEIQKINDSKRVFADRSAKSISEDEMVDAHILGVVTQKGVSGTKFGRDILEKASNDNAGVRLPDGTSDNFEQVVSTAIERDIELELVLDPMFRKVNMTSASMIVPTMPDAGYASWADNSFDPTNGDTFKGNLDDRAGGDVDMTQIVLTTARLISRSYIANETEEDAIMPVLPLIREAMVRSHARAIENSLLLGGVAGQVASNGTSYNGLCALAAADSKVLDSGSAGTTGGVIATADALLNMRQAMGKYGRRPGDVMYIISLDAYYDLLDDADFQPINEVGDQRATRITGEIANIYGSPVVVCDEFAGGKTQGNYWGVAVNARNFVIPQLRGVTVDSDYQVAEQRRVLVATQRRGFKNLFADGAGGQVVAHTW
jgi:hypothetical protein